MFKKASKVRSKLRLALSGPSGSGKTYTALAIASGLGQDIAVIDTERGSASKYADLFEFDVCELEDFHPAKYVEAIRAAAGYDVIVIDSLSHAWFSELDMVQGNFNNWTKIKPLERALIDAMLSSPAHLIGTMRSKTEWILKETTNSKGKKTMAPEKVGTSPIQASGIEYEFDIAGEINIDHLLTISKSRCPALSSTAHLHPGRDLATKMLYWLEAGGPPVETVESKCDRIRLAREAAGLDSESVRALLQSQFGLSHPQYLNSRQCDELIALLEGITEPVQ